MLPNFNAICSCLLQIAINCLMSTFWTSYLDNNSLSLELYLIHCGPPLKSPGKKNSAIDRLSWLTRDVSAKVVRSLSSSSESLAKGGTTSCLIIKMNDKNPAQRQRRMSRPLRNAEERLRDCEVAQILHSRNLIHIQFKGEWATRRWQTSFLRFGWYAVNDRSALGEKMNAGSIWVGWPVGRAAEMVSGAVFLMTTCNPTYRGYLT